MTTGGNFSETFTRSYDKGVMDDRNKQHQPGTLRQSHLFPFLSYLSFSPFIFQFNGWYSITLYILVYIVPFKIYTVNIAYFKHVLLHNNAFGATLYVTLFCQQIHNLRINSFY